MGSFLYALLMMSVSGSIMFLAAELIYKRTGGRSAGWHYSMLITAVMLFLIPLGSIFSIPKLYTVTIPDHTGFTAVSAVPAVSDISSGNPKLVIDIAVLIFAVYAVPATVMLIKLFAEYIYTRKRLLMASTPSFDPQLSAVCNHICILMGLQRRVRIRKSPCIRSPMLFGIITPYIILPEKNFTDYELSLIFKHELTHLKHMDILIKFLSSVACALHWFNPLSYKLKRSVSEGCELCCDESVLKYADKSYKKDYGMLLISVIERSNESIINHTTAMAAPKESVKHRLTKIIEFKRMSLPVRIITAMTVMSLTVCSVTVLGFETAATAMPESLRDTLLSDSDNNDSNDTDIIPVISDASASPLPSAAPSPSPSAAVSEDQISHNISEDQSSAQDAPSSSDDTLPTENAAEIQNNAADYTLDSQVQDVQTFSEGNDVPPENSFVQTDTAAAEPFVPSLPDDSYVFNFAGAGSGEIENRFMASEDCTACIYRSNDSSERADIAVYDMSDGNRMIFDSASEGNRNYYIYIHLKQGHEYSIRTFNPAENENLYIFAETRNYMFSSKVYE